MTLDLLDRKLLNLVQTEVPLTEEPFKALGARLGIAEEEVLQRLSALKRQRVIREIDAIFDTRRLGYSSSLVAMRFPPARLDRAARLINQHPGVSHNYARDGYFNLWFTLATPPAVDLNATVARIAQETAADAYHLLPAIRTFKIGVNFDMLDGKGASSLEHGANGHNSNGREGSDQPERLTDLEVQAVRELQQDLPLVSRPFDGMAQRLRISTTELLTLAQRLRERGVMRRFGAVLHHRQAGFTANAMVVWRVPSERAEEVGVQMASHPAVSHCYQRPTFPDWPYSHFTMVHATSREGCDAAAREVSTMTGVTDYTLLYSTREYKKTRVRYFV
ncbi:MAG: AsnC family transcriptional regulator [Chloroflexota bacterium]|nr:AsnC family transcriptional regulator [Chloroflexota bacterium]